jgi:hypothetical protein
MLFDILTNKYSDFMVLHFNDLLCKTMKIRARYCQRAYIAHVVRANIGALLSRDNVDTMSKERLQPPPT